MGNMLYELRETLMHELKDAGECNGKMTKERLEIIDILTHSLKNIDKLIMSDKYVYQQGEGNSYGSIRYTYDNRPAGYGNSYGYGCYNNGYDNSYGHWNMPEQRYPYSRDDAKTSITKRLEDMMREAQTDKDREAIKMCLDKINA